MGKRKICMTKIEEKKKRMVSFSKRKKGLFKKAHDLSILTGAQTAILILSETGRPYVHGFPSFESVLGRFLNQNPSSTDSETNSHSQSLPMSSGTNVEVSPIPTPNDEFDSWLNAVLDLDSEAWDDSFEVATSQNDNGVGDGFLRTLPPVDHSFEASTSQNENGVGDGFLRTLPLVDHSFEASTSQNENGVGDGSLKTLPPVDVDTTHQNDVVEDSMRALVDFDVEACDSMEELLALKQKLGDMREWVASALDCHFVDSLFA